MIGKTLRVAVFLFIAYFILTSNIFNKSVLSKISGTLKYDMITEKGQVVGGVILVITFIIISMLVQNEWI